VTEAEPEHTAGGHAADCRRIRIRCAHEYRQQPLMRRGGESGPASARKRRGAVANWLYGIAMPRTSAPCTGLPPHAVILTWSWSDFDERVTLGDADAPEITSCAGGVSWVTWITPVPTGHPLGGIVPVGLDVIAVEPAELRAVTVTRRV
jgi:hypothetical protein